MNCTPPLLLVLVGCLADPTTKGGDPPADSGETPGAPAPDTGTPPADSAPVDTADSPVDTADSELPVETGDSGGVACFSDQAADYQADGTIDARGHLTYDPLFVDRVWTESQDHDNDGNVDYAVFNTYDAAGNPSEVRIDHDGNGSVDDLFAWTWDALGNPLTSSTDIGNDGVIDFASTYLYDAAGRLESIRADTDGDGVVDQVTTYSYDAVDRPILTETDDGADGTIDSEVVHAYDGATGLDGTSASDHGLDGTIDVLERAEYDNADRLIYTGVDFGADGSFEHEVHVTYDAGTGLVATQRIVNSEVLEVLVTYTRDALGRATAVTSVASYLGMILQTDVTTWTFGGSCP